jgi:hypothetical protein
LAIANWDAHIHHTTHHHFICYCFHLFTKIIFYKKEFLPYFQIKQTYSTKVLFIIQHQLRIIISVYSYLIEQKCELFFKPPSKNQFIFLNSIELVELVKLLLINQKKQKNNLQFKMVSYLCTRIQEEKFELIATSS